MKCAVLFMVVMEVDCGSKEITGKKETGISAADENKDVSFQDLVSNILFFLFCRSGYLRTVGRK